MSWEDLFGYVVIAVIMICCTPSDSSMKADFYEKAEEIAIEEAKSDISLAGYFTNGIINTTEGRALLQAGIRAGFDVEVDNWWVIKTIRIRERGTSNEYKCVGWGLFGFTIFNDSAISKFM